MIDVPTFQSWLAKGLGRATVFLKEHDATSYRKALLYACTHNLTYDAQCEDERTPYLWRLIELSKQQAFFRNKVWQHLTEKLDRADEYEWSQLFGLAKLLTLQGDAEMHRVMYSAFERLGFEIAGISSGRVFIELNGLVLLCYKIWIKSSPGQSWQAFQSSYRLRETMSPKLDLPGIPERRA